MEARPISGTYTTKRDGCLAYTYVGAWRRLGDRITWYVTVRRDGEFKGAPKGLISHVGKLSPASSVKRLIESSIEDLVQIEK